MVIALGISGCGGGGNTTLHDATSGKSSIVITIKWPTAGRLPPPLVIVSIQVDIISVDGSLIVRRNIPQGQATTKIDGLPAGNLKLLATALDSNGNSNAFGLKGFTTLANAIIQMTFSMDSTLDHLFISPTETVLALNSSLQLQASGVNSAGEIVLLTPGKLSWTSDNSAIVSVDTHGVATGKKNGTANIQVTDTESGKSTKVSLTVANYVIWSGERHIYFWVTHSMGVPSGAHDCEYQQGRYEALTFRVLSDSTGIVLGGDLTVVAFDSTVSTIPISGGDIQPGGIFKITLASGEVFNGTLDSLGDTAQWKSVPDPPYACDSMYHPDGTGWIVSKQP